MADKRVCVLLVQLIFKSMQHNNGIWIIKLTFVFLFSFPQLSLNKKKMCIVWNSLLWIQFREDLTVVLSCQWDAAEHEKITRLVLTSTLSVAILSMRRPRLNVPMLCYWAWEDSEQLLDISGSFNSSDDVIVFGKAQADHDRALRAVFQKFSNVNLTLNKSNCEFSKLSITFLVLFSPKTASHYIQSYPEY